MKNKKIMAVVIALAILIIAGGIYYFYTNEDNKTTLNLLEKQWIESNKNNVIDFGVTNNIPIFNVSGEGVVFDFLTALEADTKISLNEIPYEKSADVKTEYSFKLVNKASKNDILVYRDNYVLLTKNKIRYHNLRDIKSLTIGVLDKNLASVNTYLNEASNLTYKPYANVTELLAATETDVDAIVLPKIAYLKDIINSENLNIAYNIVEMSEDYVITLGKTEKLNTILTKYYAKWARDTWQESFDENLTHDYFAFKNIDDKETVKFRSKRYSYGFIENIPYDSTDGNDFVGLNNNILKKFAALANVEISYAKYSNATELLKAFNSNSIDFIYGQNADNAYKMDVYKTASVLDNRVVIASLPNDQLTVNSLKTLEGKTVAVVKGSQLAYRLARDKIKLKEYADLNKLVLNGRDEIIAMDYYSYNYYSKKELQKYNIDYEFNLDSPNTFVMRDIKANEVFNNYFDFYLSLTDRQLLLDSAYDNLFVQTERRSDIQTLINIVSYLVLIAVIAFETVKFINKKQTKKTVLTKGDKVKYIDQMTSLKNRNYLNDNIPVWDSSEVYPQTIIIVDLNNVAYINDNYGYQEGDRIIREAANILITNQMENTDIIRTDGNEFLIYLVDYDEKQIVSYIRKLNKEFKNLSYGFGAALGYSVIEDAIKIIADAINEASLDMRSNKEELNN